MAKTVITGDVFSYNKAVEFIIAHASKTGLDTRIVQKIKLLCQEVILNIIRHAYGETKGDISVDCRVKADTFVVEITDFGIPYDSLSKKKITHASAHAPEDEVSDFEKLMGGVVDSSEYARVGGCNVVTLKKRLT